MILIDGGLLPKRLVVEVVLDDRRGERWVLFVFKVSSFANQLRGPLGCLRKPQVVQCEVVLGRRESIRFPGRPCRDPGIQGRLVPTTESRHIRSDRSGDRTPELLGVAIAVVGGKRALGMAWNDEHRKLDLRLPEDQRNEFSLLEPQGLGGRRTADRRVVPSQFRDRVRALLEPSVVCKPPIVNRIAGQYEDFNICKIQSQRKLSFGQQIVSSR